MKFLLAIAALNGLLAAQVSAQSTAYGQCGGQGWAGATTCVSGYTCIYSNPYYSQCLPGTATTSSTSKPTTTTTPKPTATSTTTVSTTTPTSTTPTTTVSGPTPTGSQIRAVESPVFHFYLQDNGGVPQLGPEASAGLFTIDGTITLDQVGSPNLFLNLNTTGTASYWPLYFGTTAVTTNWALEGDTIITQNPRQLNFIACATSNANFYDLFLQNGNDTPAGSSCTLQTIHLPCLC